MSRFFTARTTPNDTDNLLPYDGSENDFDDSGPSLPIILISAASGVAGTVIGLYITYTRLGWTLPASVFVAVLCASLFLGVTGAGLTVLTGTRAATANIAMSCGLIVVSILFLSICMLAGALAATVLVLYGR